MYLDWAGWPISSFERATKPSPCLPRSSLTAGDPLPLRRRWISPPSRPRSPTSPTPASPPSAMTSSFRYLPRIPPAPIPTPASGLALRQTVFPMRLADRVQGSHHRRMALRRPPPRPPLPQRPVRDSLHLALVFPRILY